MSVLRKLYFYTWKKICALLEACDGVPVVKDNIHRVAVVAVVAARDDHDGFLLLLLHVKVLRRRCFGRGGEVKGVGCVSEVGVV